jgi:ribonuclease HII
MSARFDASLLPAAPDLAFEQALWQAGVTAVAGLDEAGRGALAGPVAAGAVILPADAHILTILVGVRDSKQMTPAERQSRAAIIRQAALGHAVGFASSVEIDELGIIPANRLAMQRALAALSIAPAHLLLDCFLLPETALPQTSLLKGDCRSLSIAAASVLAKTARDAHMQSLDAQFPGYGFATHKGYGTVAHRQAIARLGPSAVHRKSFRLLEG